MAAPYVLLVTASSPEIRRIRRSRVLDFQQVTMPYLASFVPEGFTVRHIDEAVEEVPFDPVPDLVAITFHTPSAPHAYMLADQFRNAGSKVVLGGPHATLVPEEAELHADAVFEGEAEITWPKFLAEFRDGSHPRRYVSRSHSSLAGVPMARKDLFHRKDHTAGVMFATRGCAHSCEFCTINRMYGCGFRKKPVREAASEFASFPGRILILWDDNIACDLEYAKELFRALIPYGKWWSAQAGLKAAEDCEFLSLAAKSGCRQLFFGFESITQASVDSASKGFNRVDRYAEAIGRVHAHGMAVQAGMVFGFDEDAPEVFDGTVRFLEDTGVQNATFNILTPFPGTPLYKRLLGEGRILTRDWSRYNGRAHVVFEPKRMSPEDLLEGFKRATAKFYSMGSIFRRLYRSPVQLPWTLPLNLAYARALRRP